MTVLNCLVLIPLYATGDPLNEDQISDQTTGQHIALLLITILNALAIEAKVISAFTLIMFLYTAGSLVLMYFYWRKCLQWRFKELS
jgi:riboflavin transporter FmnP